MSGKDGAAMKLTYAVGDIHGCRDLLLRLLAAIETDARDRPYDIVFLGDYIDKGPDSAGTIDILMRLQADPTSRLEGVAAACGLSAASAL